MPASRVVALLLASCLLLPGCGEDVSPADGKGRAVLDTAEPRFDEHRVTWAHGTTLHYGSDELELQARVGSLAVSDYGFFVEEVHGRDRPRSVAQRRWIFTDGESEQELEGDIREVRGSADGRYAGWIDFDGPLRPDGRVAQVVVVDLRSGEVVFTDHSGMGGELGDDLGDRYEELPPAMLGFDADSSHAYWVDSSGSGTRKRVDLATGDVEDAAAPTETTEEFPLPTGVVVDPFRGSAANESREGRAMRLQYGFISPSGRHAVDISSPAETEVFAVDPTRRISMDYGSDRGHYFLGWLPQDRFYIGSTPRRISSYDTQGPDTIAGRLRVCSAARGTCEDRVTLPGLRDLVVPGSDSFLG